MVEHEAEAEEVPRPVGETKRVALVSRTLGRLDGLCPGVGPKVFRWCLSWRGAQLFCVTCLVYETFVVV